MTRLIVSSVAGGSHQPLVAYLERWLPQALLLVRTAPPALSIALVGDTRMAALHEKFLQLPGSTDVLTFALDHDPRGRVTTGEVVVCVPFARREAKRRGLKIEQELLLYALHGTLHLCGYDDRMPADHARMHTEEDRILRQLGIGPVFQQEL